MIFTSFAASFEMHTFCTVVTVHVPSVYVGLFPCLHIMFNSPSSWCCSFPCLHIMFNFPSAWYCSFPCLHITGYWHVCTSLFIAMSAPQFNSLSLHQLIIIPCLHVAVYFSQHISLFPCLHFTIYFHLDISLFPHLHLAVYPICLSLFISSFPSLLASVPFPGFTPLYFPSLHLYFHCRGMTGAHRVQELCESWGGHPGLSVLMSLLVSAVVKQYWIMLMYWCQLVPNMSSDSWGH